MLRALALAAILALVPVRGHFDYAHVASATPVTDDADPWNISAGTVTAGNTLVAAWSTGETGSATCGTPTTNQSDTFETLIEHRFATATRLCIAVVCNAVGGSTTLTVTHGGGATVDVVGISEYSGVADSACVEDSAHNEASGVDTITTDAVDSAGAALIVGVLSTNRNPAVAGSGSPTQRWEGTGTGVGLTDNAQDKRATGAGSHTLQWNTDSTGILIYGLAALTEAVGGGGGPTIVPAVLNSPGRGGR